jgi:hypothetical protein
MPAVVRKPLAALLAVLTLSVCIMTSVQPASAQGFAWGFLGGVVGGTLAGAAIASQPHYYYPPPYAYGPPPAPGCYVQRRPVYDPGGAIVGYRPVRVCY